MKSNPKYSFIIPAYNAAKTIMRSIESITFRMHDYEIIVAENGSTDETSSIVERLEEKNERIELIHTDKGVSKARNAGIKASSGEWLIFVDADDEWLGNHDDIEGITQKHTEAGLIICGYKKNNTLIEHDFQPIGQIVKEPEKRELVAWMMSMPTVRMTVWSKVFKRKFLICNDLHFDEELRVSEDSDMVLRSVMVADACVVVNSPVYRYSTLTSSVTRSIDDTRAEAYIKALEKMQAISDNKIPNDAVKDFIISHLNLICVHDIYNCDMNKKFRSRNMLARRLVSKSVFSKAIKGIGIRDLKRMNNLPALFFKYGMFSVGGAICYIRSVQNKRVNKIKGVDIK